VTIPLNGKIVVGFPTKSIDGTVKFFNDALGTAAQ